MKENEETMIGVLPDERSEDEKKGDLQFEEMVSAPAPVDWREKSPEEWRKFSVRDQDGSGSCVAQTLAKIAEVLKYDRDGVTEPFSASDVYQDRSNKPYPGMGAENAWTLAARGIPKEASMPSQGMSDAQMDALRKPSNIEELRRDLRPYRPVYLPTGDIELVASVMQVTKKPVMLWFYATMAEWNKDAPEILDPSLPAIGAPVRHSVTGVDFTLWNGEKAIVIDESWGRFGEFVGQRVITESFFKERNFLAVYPLSLKTNKLTHEFKVPLQYGMRKHPDVKALQQLLQRDGHFPKNIDCTGNYLAVTAESVLKFQLAHNVAPVPELTALKGRSIGPKTRAKLNELYAKE